jgi:RNA-binding protein
MRRLGKVTHVSQQGSIILKTDKTPPIGAAVVDKKVQQIGSVLDVFGPVKEPYVSIRPNRGIDGSKLVGQTLYLYRHR